MSRVKRLYFYLVAYAGLVMLLSGLGQLVEVQLERTAGAGGIGSEELRDRTALGIALAVIGLPAWLLHWRAVEGWLHGPLAADERRSGLRRLYLYAVLATCALVGYVNARDLLANAFSIPLGLSTGAERWQGLLRPLPYVALAGLFWAYHWRVAGRDRALEPEVGASATLRRWYVYGVATLGVVPLMVSLAEIGYQLWVAVVGRPTTATVGPPATLVVLAERSATALVALAVWLAHRHRADAAFELPLRGEDDRRSVLRKVYLYAVLAGTVAWALANASQVLRYLLLSLLGEPPRELGGEPILVALGRPLAAIAVFGLFWAFFWRAVRREAAAEEEVGRQASVRRLYSYLVSGVSLAILLSGLAGLLRLLVDVLALPPSVDAGGAREALAGELSKLLIAVPVWLAHWHGIQRLLGGPAGADEMRATTRRWYLYLVAFAAVATLLVVGAWVVYDLSTILLGRSLDRELAAELGRLLATSLVAGLTLWYHWWLVLRADLAATRQDATDRAVAIVSGLSATQAEALAGFVRERLVGSDVKLIWTDRERAREAVERMG